MSKNTEQLLLKVLHGAMVLDVDFTQWPTVFSIIVLQLEDDQGSNVYELSCIDVLSLLVELNCDRDVGIDTADSPVLSTANDGDSDCLAWSVDMRSLSSCQQGSSLSMRGSFSPTIHVVSADMNIHKIDPGVCKTPLIQQTYGFAGSGLLWPGLLAQFHTRYPRRRLEYKRFDII